MGKKIKKIRELPIIFSEIEKRIALNYQIAINLQVRTTARFMSSKFSIFSLVLKFPKDDDKIIFNEIFKRLLDNDRKLSKLLKEAQIENLGINI